MSSSSFDLVDDFAQLSLSSSGRATSASSFATEGSGDDVAVASPTRANLAAHLREQQASVPSVPSVRRQFVCPDHGSFWKKVPVGGNKRDGSCVARCKKCPVINGLGVKYHAIPVEEERGKGLFECPECGNVWTSNTACRSLAQYCFVENCSGRDAMCGVFPKEIRAPDPGWLRARRFARGRARNPTIDENAPFNGDVDGGDGAFPLGVDSERAPQMPQSRQSRRKHFCAGCEAGTCKHPPPPSTIHESSGSTAATMSGKTWSTCNSEWSVGSVHTGDTMRSPATQSRSRRRRFYAGGRAADRE